jgi:hypothetical protein
MLKSSESGSKMNRPSFPVYLIPAKAGNSELAARPFVGAKVLPSIPYDTFYRLKDFISVLKYPFALLVVYSQNGTIEYNYITLHSRGQDSLANKGGRGNGGRRSQNG